MITGINCKAAHEIFHQSFDIVNLLRGKHKQFLYIWMCMFLNYEIAVILSKNQPYIIASKDDNIVIELHWTPTLSAKWLLSAVTWYPLVNNFMYTLLTVIQNIVPWCVTKWNMDGLMYFPALHSYNHPFICISLRFPQFRNAVSMNRKHVYKLALFKCSTHNPTFWRSIATIC